MRSSVIIYPDEVSRKWIDRMADAGITVLGIHPRGGKYSAGSLQALVDKCKDPAFRELLDYAAQRGLEIEYEIHAAGYLLPRELFETHPEYFRQDQNGERVVKKNFCVSNTEALDMVAQRAADLAVSLYRSSRNFYFWMDDGRDIHCHCPQCCGLSASDQQLTVLNAMIRQIRKRIPDARLAYLAYIDSIVLPEKVQPEEGIFLEYAPFEKYTARTENAPQLIAREQRMLDPLLRFFGHRGAKVLEYWYDNSMWSRWTKPPKHFVLDAAAMAGDIAAYRAMGFESISTFACFLGQEYEGLYCEEPDVAPFGEAVR